MTAEDQEALVEIVRRRSLDRGRKRLTSEAEEAQRELTEGRCRPTTPGELMDEILS